MSSRGENKMTALLNATLKLKIWKDTNGQDLIEYALMCGFLAAASGAVLPNISASLSSVMSSVVAVLGPNGTPSAPG
jgi:pilus assembly protein Flp/PilA